MNYNDNGTIKQITVKAGDTLPVGTEVDVPLETTTPSGYEEVSTMLVENASIQVAGQLDLQSYGITNEYFVLSAYASGYMLIPFVYGARWFLKVLDTTLNPVSAGTSLTFTLKYEKSSKKIKKTYNGVVPNGKILNSYSISQNDGYSCNYINNDLNNYSTEEQRIGTYLGKPLYRKVITTTTPNSTTDSVVGSIGADKQAVKIDGYVDGGNTYQTLPINFYFSDEYSIATYVTNNNGNIHMKLNSVNYQNKDVKIIIEYTKTTD